MRDEQGAPRVSRRAGVLRLFALDVAGPLVVYAVCRAAGLAQVWSLVVSGSPPGFGVVFDWRRWRTLEVVGAIVLGGIALSVALALITASPKAVLLESAGGNGGFGLLCLLSLARRRPLIFHFGQALYGGRHTADGAELDAEYDTEERARFFWRTSTAIWGVTYVVEAAALSAVVETQSAATALIVNRTVPWIVFAGLFAAIFRWGNGLRAGYRRDR